MLKSAGVKTLPGTGVRLLGDDKVSNDWTKTIRTAHLEGMRTTSVISYGYGESPRERISHLRKLTMIHAETFGFTECVLMPAPSATFTPILSRRSRLSEHRAMAAVTRLLLNANISQVQAAWTRLSFEELVATLRSGANDIGGTLHKGRVLANASAEGDRYLSSDGLEKLSMQLMRSLRQRNTTYEELGPEQTLEAAI
jgi:FO synthase